MGCGGGRVINDVVKNSKIKIKVNVIYSLDRSSMLNNIRSKFYNVLKSNPFYNMSVDRLKLVSLNSNFIELDKITETILKEVYSVSFNRLSPLLPSDRCESSILLFIVLFLAKPSKKEIKIEKLNLVNFLVNLARDKTDSIKFSSGKLSYMIINLIHFICYIIIYFLMSFVVLQTFDNFNRQEIEQLLIERIKIRNISYVNIKEYFIAKFEKMNPKLQSAESILNCCLPYVFEPIKDLIKSQSDVETVLLSETEVKEIVTRIVFLYDPDNFIDVFLSLKVKDY